MHALEHDVFGMFAEELEYVFHVGLVRQPAQAYTVFSCAAGDDVLRQRQQRHVPENRRRRIVYAGRCRHRGADAVAVASRRPYGRVHRTVQNLGQIIASQGCMITNTDDARTKRTKTRRIETFNNSCRRTNRG